MWLLIVTGARVVETLAVSLSSIVSQVFGVFSWTSWKNPKSLLQITDSAFCPRSFLFHVLNRNLIAWLVWGFFYISSFSLDFFIQLCPPGLSLPAQPAPFLSNCSLCLLQRRWTNLHPSATVVFACSQRRWTNLHSSATVVFACSQRKWTNQGEGHFLSCLLLPAKKKKLF